MGFFTRRGNKVPSPSIGHQRGGVFVIGNARSGTTVLQNALNASRDLFLFGEPEFHVDPGTADFATRYNARHAAWRNHPNKSSFCPPLFEQDAPWHAYVNRLSEFYAHVGAKNVINPGDDAAAIGALFAFQCQHFYGAQYIFAFRNPRDVLVSIQGMQRLQGEPLVPPALILTTFLRVISLFILMLRNLPRVAVLFHDAVAPGFFEQLGVKLGSNLTGAADYYVAARVHTYAESAVPADARADLAEVAALYDKFKALMLAGPGLVQLEQNAGHLDAQTHLTPLGRLAGDVETMALRLDALVPRG